MRIADHVEITDGRFGHIVEFPGPMHAVVAIHPGDYQTVVHKDNIRVLAAVGVSSE
jgi:hypothetical protein